MTCHNGKQINLFCDYTYKICLFETNLPKMFNVWTIKKFGLVQVFQNGKHFLFADTIVLKTCIKINKIEENLQKINLKWKDTLLVWQLLLHLFYYYWRIQTTKGTKFDKISLINKFVYVFVYTVHYCQQINLIKFI